MLKLICHMRKSNVDISNLPKFNSLDEAKDYFNKFGKLTFWGWEMTKPPYAIYTYVRNDTREYFIDIFEDGTVVVIDKYKLLYGD